MALKVYTKSEIEVRSPEKLEKMRQKEIPRRFNQRVKKAKKKESKDEYLLSMEASRRLIKVLAVSLVLLGISIVTYATYPYVKYSFAKLVDKEQEQSVVSMAGDPSVLSLQSRRSDQYFDNVQRNIALVSDELEASVQEDYSGLQGVFYLTVPKIGLDRVPVQLNVNSFNEAEYDSVLKSRLAHFRGSVVPGKPGTTFVYGHSTAEWFAEANPDFFGTVFTYLPEMNIGDKFSVEYEGMKYEYVVVKVHIIEPSDLSPVFENDGRKLFKMMTCTPPGVGTDRHITVGEQVSATPL